MKIETKFEVGQKVYHLKNNKVNVLEIDKIRIEINLSVKIIYICQIDYEVKENEIFASKEDLLNTL